MKREFTQEEQFERAKQRMHEADEWMNNNWDAFCFIIHLASLDYRSNRPMCMTRYFEQARAKTFTSQDGSNTKFNNNLRAALARKLLEACPMFRGKLKLRKSICDSVYDANAGGVLNG
ncbi:MAG: hypothetical protein IKE43_06080 [Coriobacteriales bacterium]|nr:hypothetical protein [Coriobacteriales bacterium]